MPILVSGSLAYDVIMDFPDRFANHLLPDQLHILNISFVVDRLERQMGGVAGNIAYTMALLGEEPLVLGMLGKDADVYLAHLKERGISAEHIGVSKTFFTATAHITTDKDDNQICAFYPGAMVETDALAFPSAKTGVSLAIIGPSTPSAMVAHAKTCAERGIPIVFDPGQQVSALSPQELMLLVGQAQFLIGNDYELKLLEEKTGWDAEELLNHVDVLITTLGEKGSVVRTKDERFAVSAAPVSSVDDPTGAGDAYRAGFFAAQVRGCDLLTCARIGSVAASFAVERYGTQAHAFTADEFGARFEKAYDAPPPEIFFSPLANRMS